MEEQIVRLFERPDIGLAEVDEDRLIAPQLRSLLRTGVRRKPIDEQGHGDKQAL